MFKKIVNIIKKIIVSFLLIYAYNKMTLPLGIYIPMNFFTVLLATFCGIPAIIMFICYRLLFI